MLKLLGGLLLALAVIIGAPSAVAGEGADQGRLIREGDVVIPGGDAACADYCVRIERHGQVLVHYIYAGGRVIEVHPVQVGPGPARLTSATVSFDHNVTTLAIADPTGEIQPADVMPAPPTPPSVPPGYTGAMVVSYSYVVGNTIYLVMVTYVYVDGELEYVTQETRTFQRYIKVQ